MKHSRIAMLAAAVLFLMLCGYHLYSGRPLDAGLAALTSVIAFLTFQRLKDAPRAV